MEQRDSSSAIGKLVKKGLIHPPPFVIGSTQYETIMGSMAYAVSSDTSDMDIYGWCIEPKDMVFHHLAGHIPGFGTPPERFEQFQKHGVVDLSTGKKYDFSIFGIVKYFNLAMGNNPNMIDSLFTPENCVLKATSLARHVRDHRRSFLHKGAWHTFKGYAYGQLKHIKTKKPTPGSARAKLVEKYGYDTKFAYHVVRLLGEVEQILTEGDIDLTRDNERLKAIRAGEWTLDQIQDFFNLKERTLEEVYNTSKLPYRAPEPIIRRLLLEVLEEYYGSIEALVARPSEYKEMLLQIKDIVGKL